MTRYSTIYITGASRGLGAALAVAYAQPARNLALAGRDQSLLQSVSDTCRAKGATVQTATFDIRDLTAQTAFLAAVTEKSQIDLAICNAGIFFGRPKGETMEPPELARLQVDVNLWGTIATVHAVTAAMNGQRKGRIALVSSLAAPHPLADAPAYSASKAGICAYATALRELLAPNIGVTLVLPGHIRTEQTKRHEGTLTGIVSPDAAAAKIVQGLERERSEIVFPKHLHWLALAGRLLPYRASWFFNRPQRFTVTREISSETPMPSAKLDG